jgi:hypothetical protein
MHSQFLFLCCLRALATLAVIFQERKRNVKKRKANYTRYVIEKRV